MPKIIYFALILMAVPLLSSEISVNKDKTELMFLLKKLRFNKDLSKDLAREVRYKGRVFSVDTEGNFYLEDSKGKKHVLNIYYDEKQSKGKQIFIIEDPNHPSAGLPYNPYSTRNATPQETLDFANLVQLQRLIGIHAMKTKHPECYFAYAAQRLKLKHPYKTLLNLEKENNPKPLGFINAEEWEEFKSDLQALFKPFASPDAHIVLIGTSTTFFSENPLKGKNISLFESYPQCLKSIQDPEKISTVYTFDTPGKRSDLDLHVLIPSLSNLCDKAEEHVSLGNTGERNVYFENSVYKCFLESKDSDIRNQVKDIKVKVFNLFDTTYPDKALGRFIRKWTKNLKRPINFSVVIRPDQRKSPLSEPGVKDFNESAYLKRPIVIPIRN